MTGITTSKIISDFFLLDLHMIVSNWYNISKRCGRRSLKGWLMVKNVNLLAYAV